MDGNLRGAEALDSFNRKVAGQEMRVSEKGDHSLGPKWKRPRANKGSWGGGQITWLPGGLTNYIPRQDPG